MLSVLGGGQPVLFVVAVASVGRTIILMWHGIMCILKTTVWWIGNSTNVCSLNAGVIYTVNGINNASVQAANVRTVANPRSEEHTSELQSRGHLVCRLLLEKKKKTK